MILLRLLSWQYVRKHMLRCMLTIAGIVLGVAVFVGMHTANQSVLQAFNKTVDRIAGSTQLQVTAGETGFPEETLERVQSLPQVRVAVPVIEAVVHSGLEGQGNLLILAVDMTGDRSLREYDLEEGDESVIEDPLVFLAQPDSIIITREFAQRNGLRADSKLSMQTMEGPRQFIVRGIMKSGGLTSAFAGNLAIMDIYAAQKVFGRGRTFDRIDIGVQEGVRIEEAQSKLRKLLGSGYEVELPSSRGRQFESLTSVYAGVANITSLFALFIGMFIIYNSFSIAVGQRRSEIGIVRALGATRRQIQALFLAESAVAGVTGALLGVLFGIAIARGVAGYIGGYIGEVFGVAQRAEELSADPRLLGAALIIGVVTSVVAGWIPARNAASIDPVRALQKGRYQVLSAGENRARRFVAIACLLAAVACLFPSENRAFFYAGYMLAVLAALLMTPTLALWLSRSLRPALKWLRPVEGALAADSLIQAPRRTSGVVSALMLALALVISLAGMARAGYSSIHEWLQSALNPDFFVTPDQSLTNRHFRFPASIGEEIGRIPGVNRVQAVRSGRFPLRGDPVLFVALDIASLERTSWLRSTAGNPENMYRAAAAGRGVIISDNLSHLMNIRLGDMLDLPAPRGSLRLPVCGIVVDFSDQKGSVLMDRKVFLEHWGDDTINVFRVFLSQGADPAQVRRRILDRFGNVRRLFVLSNQEVRAYVLKLTDQWFGLSYVQIAVAVLVAVLGIVNTLTVSISDRRRELGVLQAVGGLRNQIRHTIWMEAVAIGAVGLILGLALGAISLYYSLDLSKNDLGGIALEYMYPVGIALVLLPVILGAAFLAALGPAEQAVRGSLVEALEYE